MIIQQARCPRCAFRRTVRLDPWGAFCFNCRLQWDTQAVAHQEMGVARSTPPPVQYPFVPAELIRLERYQAAIRAGLYSDWPRPQATGLDVPEAGPFSAQAEHTPLLQAPARAQTQIERSRWHDLVWGIDLFGLRVRQPPAWTWHAVSVARGQLAPSPFGGA